MTGSANWIHGGGTSFGACTPADERLHRDLGLAGDALTETYAYMFYVPEARISALLHYWVHPNMDIVAAGLIVWQGHKTNQLTAELFDVRTYTPAAILGDGSNVTFPTGLHVEIVEPFRDIRIRYEDPARGNAVDIAMTEYSPPVMRENRTHFDQACKTRGSITLRGRTFAIDSYGMRDRSWGEQRPETPFATPPYCWMTGIFPDARFAWNLCAFDDPRQAPDWHGHFDVDPEQCFKDGWIWRDGALTRLREGRQITRRDPATLRPVSHVLDVVDLQGRSYRITGEVTASLPFHAWHNMLCWVCLTEWSWEGLVGFGDTQEVQWTDFIRALRGDQQLLDTRSR